MLLNIKLGFLIRIFVLLIGFIFFSCDNQADKKIAEQKMLNNWPNSYNGTATFYAIGLSIRKIDSLTAELNLRFSKRNELGL